MSRDGGRDVHRGRQEHAGPAGEPPVLDLAHRRVALRRRAPPTSSVDGHRSDDLKPYLFVTRDYGKTWQSIVSNLPAFGNIQVVREDPKNKDLLYVGTEFGLFISTRRRQAVAEVHEQPADGARRRHPRPSARQRSDRRDARRAASGSRTTSRRCSSCTPAVRAGRRRSSTSVRRSRGSTIGSATSRSAGRRAFVGENAPRGATINYYLKSARDGDVKISDRRRQRARRSARSTARRTPGINRVDVEPHDCAARLRARRPTSRARNVRCHAHGKRQVRQQARAGAAGRVAQGEVSRDQGSGIRDPLSAVRDPQTSRPLTRGFPDPGSRIPDPDPGSLPRDSDRDERLGALGSLRCFDGDHVVAWRDGLERQIDLIEPGAAWRAARSGASQVGGLAGPRAGSQPSRPRNRRRARRARAADRRGRIRDRQTAADSDRR